MGTSTHLLSPADFIMTDDGFDGAVRRLFLHEGGFSDHPKDPGGPTKYGITINDVRRFVKADATIDDVRALTIAQARAIYRDKYWDALRCDELPAGVDYAVFDYGVNSGVGRAGRVVRRVLALPGRLTGITARVVAAAHRANAADLVNKICNERMRFLRGLSTWPTFGAGWTRRVAEVRRVALALAQDQATPAARPKSIKPPERSRVAPSAGAVVAGTAAALEAHAHGARPLLVAAIVAAAVAVAIGVFIYMRWRARRTPLSQPPAE